MQVRIITQNLALADWERDLLLRRVRRTLVRFAHRIESVIVSFEDLNGPRGGIDIQCRIRVLMLPTGKINVSAEEMSAYLALYCAIQRAKRRLRTPTPDWSRNAANIDHDLGIRGLRLRS